MGSPDKTIAITGIGLVTSLGWSLSKSFDRLLLGESGIQSGTWNSNGTSPTNWAGYPVDMTGVAVRQFWADPVFAILEFAAHEAIADSGVNLNQIDPARRAAVISLSKGPVKLQSQMAERLESHGPNSLESVNFDWSVLAPSAGSTFISQQFDVQGPLLAPVTACASGLTALRQASSILAGGHADWAIAGAADASLEPFIQNAFSKMKSLATASDTNEQPRDWVKPWSARRNGFLVGEGGAVFILERLADVQRSGRRPVAILDGFGCGAEAYHPTRPHHSAEVLARAIQKTISDDHNPIDAVYLHATATRGYDPLECLALRHALSGDAAMPWIMASKSQLGHCLGAAGAVELAICCESIRRQILPPFAPADSGDFYRFGRITGPTAIHEPVDSILKMVAGFGGHVEVCRLTRP